MVCTVDFVLLSTLVRTLFDALILVLASVLAKTSHFSDSYFSLDKSGLGIFESELLFIRENMIISTM